MLRPDGARTLNPEGARFRSLGAQVSDPRFFRHVPVGVVGVVLEAPSLRAVLAAEIFGCPELG